MTKRTIVVMMAVVLCAAMTASADSFGTGANQFDIDFVTISGATNPASNQTMYGIVEGDYRMGVYEITNDQWGKFTASLGVPVTGSPANAYDESPVWTGANVPTNMTSWYEAAQFVNYLNTSTGHQAAYKFTGTQGTPGYAPGVWSAAEADNGTNLYRHKDAFYFLPTNDEWAKAGYWNGAWMTFWPTPDGSPSIAGIDSNWAQAVGQPWDVGSGSEELNGTFDMLGNVWEWLEGPSIDLNYGVASGRRIQGAAYYSTTVPVGQISAGSLAVHSEYDFLGFRVASQASESATLVDLDIKPGSDRNPVNLMSRGKLPVVVFGSAELDVSTIDLTTLLLNGVAPAEKKNGSLFASIEDEDGDGFMDLVMHFILQDLGIEGGMTELFVTGSFLDGLAFEGSDVIDIVPDFNGDLVVNTMDLATLAAGFGSANDWTGGDANGDGMVNTTDLMILAANFGVDSSADTIPEPATMSLLALGALAVLRRRRR